MIEIEIEQWEKWKQCYDVSSEWWGEGGGTMGKLYWLLEGLKMFFKGQFGVEFDL